MTIFCPACGAETAPGSRFCAACGGTVVVARAPGDEGAPCAVHPESRASGPCPRCGTFACPACLVRDPRGETICRACLARSEPDLLPWDRRGEIGVVKAWWQTSLLLIRAPTQGFDTARREGTLTSSFLFAVLANVAGLLTTGLLYGLMVGGFMFALSRTTPDPEISGPASAGIAVGLVVVLAVIGPLMGAGTSFVFAALDHLMLRLVGANPGSFAVTFRAYALSQAPYLVGLVPICGLYLFPIWSLVIRVFAYRSFHRTSGGRAAAGALIAPVVSFLVFIAGYILVVAFAVSQAPG